MYVVYQDFLLSFLIYLIIQIKKEHNHAIYKLKNIPLRYLAKIIILTVTLNKNLFSHTHSYNHSITHRETIISTGAENECHRWANFFWYIITAISITSQPSIFIQNRYKKSRKKIRKSCIHLLVMIAEIKCNLRNEFCQ